ncbi:hypothetical protein MG1_01609, partial [Candida albicans GC75]
MTSNNDDNVNLEKLNISDEIINDYDNGSQEQLDVLEAYQTDEDKQEQKEKEKDVELDNPDLEEEVGITMNDDEGDHKLNNQKIDDEINKEDEKDVKASDDDHDDDDDDDFDDFNEASFQQAPTIGSTNQENGHDDNDDDDDDEFGDFDDFQVSQPSPTQQQQKQQSQTQSQSISIDKVNFPTTIFNSPKEFSQRLTTTLDEIFSTSTPILEDNNNNNKNQITTSIQLLNERSQEIYKQLSTLPYLQPTNWIKSNIRHNLLIKLGIPINLDELNDTNTISANPNNKNIVTSETQNDLKIPGYNFGSGGGGGGGSGGGFVSVSGRQRKSSISINDINWNELNLISEIPKFESLNIDDNLKNSLINSTLDKLNQFELDNLYHNSTTTTTTTISVTTAAEGDGSNNNNNNNKSNSSSNDSGSTIGGGHANSQWIDEKLNKLTSNYNELLTLSSIWINQIDQLHEEFEIYENVIQSFIGYNQKLRREEIFENLKKLKKKNKKGKATKK